MGPWVTPPASVVAMGAMQPKRGKRGGAQPKASCFKRSGRVPLDRLLDHQARSYHMRHPVSGIKTYVN